MEIRVFWAFLIVLSVTKGFVPSVLYVSFQLDETRAYNSSNDRVIINISDDTPLVEVPIPSLFPFFGEFIDRIFVSPNGYVQTSPVNLCRCCFCDPCFADYFGMIAGILSDLNTYDFENSHVSAHRDNLNVTTIYYNRVNIFGTLDPLLDFGIRLFPDGAVNLLYDSVTSLDTISIVASNCSWLSGLVAPNATLSQYEFKVTVEQKVVQRDVWAARNPGVYPYSRTEVVSGSHHVFCPISTVWGVSPSLINSKTKSLNLTTLSMSCLRGRHDLNHSIRIAILISLSSEFRTMEIMNQSIAECHPFDTSSLLKPAPVSFMCNLNSVNMSLFEEEDELSIDIVWSPARLASHVSNYRYLGSSSEVPTLFVNYSATAAEISTQCALNSIVGSCSACEVVQSGFQLDAEELTCLSLDCSIDYSQPTMATYHSAASFSYYSDMTSFQALYMRPSCHNEVCEDTFQYYVDNMGDCCALQYMDCMGRCNGTSVAGMEATRGWLHCCSPGVALDCLGYCNGPAVVDCLGVCQGSAVLDCGNVCNGTTVRDACGVCGGSDHLECPSVSITVDTGPNPLNSDHHLATEYDARNPFFVSSVPLVVSNPNDVAINVSFFFSKKHTLPPSISLPIGIHRLRPYSNMTFAIRSNVSALFNLSVAWAVNTISIKYSRTNLLPAYTYAIDVLPSMRNCSGLADMDSCMSFPGCEFCLSRPGSERSGELRILSEEDSPPSKSDWDIAFEYYYAGMNQAVARSGEGGGHSVHARALFSSIVPYYRHSLQDEDVLTNGYCGTGFSACVALTSPPSAAAHTTVSTLFVSLLMIGVFAVMLLIK